MNGFAVLYFLGIASLLITFQALEIGGCDVQTVSECEVLCRPVNNNKTECELRAVLISPAVKVNESEGSVSKVSMKKYKML